MHAISVTMETTASSGTEFLTAPLLVVKEEPDDDSEELEPNSNTSNAQIICEPDPMNLLDPMDEEYVCNVPNSESPFELEQSISGPTKEMWDTWMAECPWLLHEEDDEHYGYCLYCNFKMNFKNVKGPRNHARTRSHMENEQNYLAFKAHEEKSKLSCSFTSFGIKQEFVVENNSSSLRLERMLEADSFNDFNWARWQNRHTWLQREGDDPTRGYCKYCQVYLSVEYSYMRLRHEDGIKHKNSFREYIRHQNLPSAEMDNIGVKLSISTKHSTDTNTTDFLEQSSSDYRTEHRNLEEYQDEHNNTEEFVTNESLNKGRIRKAFKSPWFEMMNNNPQTCRCTLCDVSMIVFNFRRHLGSQMHSESEKLLVAEKKNKINVESRGNGRNWKMYAKKHPWLVEDPLDPSYAYCKYCKKRLLYGIHPMKRLIHERGHAHNKAVKMYRKYMTSSTTSNDGTEDEKTTAKQLDESNAETLVKNEDNFVNEEYVESGNNMTEQKIQRRYRFVRGSDEWIKMFPWCRKYSKDPNFCFCIYCKVKLSINFRRKKHEESFRHKRAERNILLKLPKFRNNKKPVENDDESWFIQSQNANYIFCKYCRIRLGSWENHDEHLASEHHKNCIRNATEDIKWNFATPAIMSVSNSQETPTAADALITNVTAFKGPIRFPWLVYRSDETLPNYGYCTYCEARIYTPTDKLAIKHQKSAKHMRRKYEHIQKLAREGKTLATDREDSWQMYPWLVQCLESKEYGYCKYCNVRLNITGSLKYRHEMTMKHKESAKRYVIVTTNAANMMKYEQPNADSFGMASVSMVMGSDDTTNGIARLTKSTDHVSPNQLALVNGEASPQSTNEVTGNEEVAISDGDAGGGAGAGGGGSSLVERAKRLSAAHDELLQLSRDMSDNKRREMTLTTNILNSTAGLVALLSSPQTSMLATPPPLRNTMELFFDSVCESIKALPTDLAAEGKIKIMQLVADLELRALHRVSIGDTMEPQSNAVTNSETTQNCRSPAVSSATTNDDTYSIATAPPCLQPHQSKI